MVEQPVQRFYWPEKAFDWLEPARMMNMRNGTCVWTQTSKVPS